MYPPLTLKRKTFPIQLKPSFTVIWIIFSSQSPGVITTILNLLLMLWVSLYVSHIYKSVSIMQYVHILRNCMWLYMHMRNFKKRNIMFVRLIHLFQCALLLCDILDCAPTYPIYEHLDYFTCFCSYEQCSYECSYILARVPICYFRKWYRVPVSAWPGW